MKVSSEREESKCKFYRNFLKLIWLAENILLQKKHDKMRKYFTSKQSKHIYLKKTHHMFPLECPPQVISKGKNGKTSNVCLEIHTHTQIYELVPVIFSVTFRIVYTIQ